MYFVPKDDGECEIFKEILNPLINADLKQLANFQKLHKKNLVGLGRRIGNILRHYESNDVTQMVSVLANFQKLNCQNKNI